MNQRRDSVLLFHPRNHDEALGFWWTGSDSGYGILQALQKAPFALRSGQIIGCVQVVQERRSFSVVLFKQKLLSYIIVRSKLPGAYTLPISQTRDPRAPFEWMKKQSTGLIRLFPLFYLLGFVIVVIGLAKFFTLPDQRGIPIARAIFLYSVAFPFGYFYLNRNSIKTSWDLRHLKMISLTFIAAGYFVLRKLIF